MSTRTIGKLAREAGVGVETIRFYERKGYLEQPPRGPGYRRYDDRALATVRFLKAAQAMGFRLQEVCDALAAAPAAGQFCAAVRDAVLAKREELVAERAVLDARIAAADAMMAACARRDPAQPCPIAANLQLFPEETPI